MPSSRAGPSVRREMSSINTPRLSQSRDSPAQEPTTASSRAEAPQAAAPSIIPPSQSGLSRTGGLSISIKNPRSETPSTLRRSYRRTLALSNGLRVRMRTLFLPQLLPPRPTEISLNDDQVYHEEDDEEKKIALSVEVENPLDGDRSFSFEVDDITVEVGGKGGKAIAELLCLPEELRAGPSNDTAMGDPSKQALFPLNLLPVEQYNLLYAVHMDAAEDISAAPPTNSASSGGRGDDQRPVAIIVSGRPYRQSPSDSSVTDEKSYPTGKFQSRWNCTLDLTPFYASARAKSNIPSIVPTNNRQRNSKPVSLPRNAIVGDKRYSLANLNASKRSSVQSDPSRPNLPPNPSPAPMMGARQASRVSSMGHPPSQHSSQGMLVSVKILPPPSGQIRPLEAFSIEVYVHNRTDEIKRFRLIVPGREWSRKGKEMWEKRRERDAGEVKWGMDDPSRSLLRQWHAFEWD